MSQSFSPSFSTAFKLFQSLKLREDLLQSSSREAMRVLSQPDFWTSLQRGVFRQAFEGVLFESLDHLALARFTLPAEYVAAMIVAFVDPVNHLVACKWSEHHGVDADSMAISVNETAEYEPFTARQMFAIVCNLSLIHISEPTRPRSSSIRVSKFCISRVRKIRLLLINMFRQFSTSTK